MKTLIATLAWITLAASASADLDSSIKTILSVGSEGEGNPAAAAAWEELSQSDLSAAPIILEHFQDANPLAANYLRSAVETIVARETSKGQALPTAELGEVLLDVRQSPKAREFAFQLIEGVRPDVAEKLVPGLLNDPSTALRRRAVSGLIEEADALAKAENQGDAALIYRQALNAARDIDQVNAIAKAVRDLGQEVDLPRHFGFIMHWSTIAPFDNTDRAGFDTVFPPENGVDLTATLPGKEGDVSWQPLVTTDEYGKVDFNKPYGLLKEVTGYAYAEFESDSDRPAEIRLGCKNGWKVWVNGEFLFGRDEYHRGQRIDQYILPTQLRKGTNTILVKCCQDGQEQDWTVQWEFQLRVCDAAGTAILAVDRPPTPQPETTRRRPSAG